MDKLICELDNVFNDDLLIARLYQYYGYDPEKYLKSRYREIVHGPGMLDVKKRGLLFCRECNHNNARIIKDLIEIRIYIYECSKCEYSFSKLCDCVYYDTYDLILCCDKCSTVNCKFCNIVIYWNYHNDYNFCNKICKHCDIRWCVDGERKLKYDFNGKKLDLKPNIINIDGIDIILDDVEIKLDSKIHKTDIINNAEHEKQRRKDFNATWKTSTLEEKLNFHGMTKLKILAKRKGLLGYKHDKKAELINRLLFVTQHSDLPIKIE